MHIVPAAAKLNRRHAGRAIGYRVLNLDRSLFRKFRTDNVTEATPGYYVAVGGVEAPDGGGFVVWGTDGRDIIEASVEQASATPNDVDALISSRIGELIDRLDAGIGSLSHQVESIDMISTVSDSEKRIRESTRDKINDLQAKIISQFDESLTDGLFSFRSDFQGKINAMGLMIERLAPIYAASEKAAENLNPLIESLIENLRDGLTEAERISDLNEKEARTLALIQKYNREDARNKRDEKALEIIRGYMGVNSHA